MLSQQADGPSVSLSFANNFWGKEDAGVAPLLERMVGAKQTCDELKSFYNTRASIEDEYARKLLSLCRKPLGTHESGGLKLSLDVMRGEVEAMAKQHQSIAQQMKSELEEPLAAFAGAMKERRKIVQNSIEKLHKIKSQQTQQVNKTRDRYENECLKIKGYLAQGHMVMGQEERKNKAKLEKTQINVATSNTEYENSVKILEETTARWNREWKAAADKFQDLEEERLDFTKSSLWSFANIASTVCVSDDASCEKIRLSLEKLEVEKDISNFITERGTGQEIPDPPKYVNFCRGDLDSQSDTSEDENYSVAQFPRSINPAYRTSSPQPSTYESHHDPNSALARDLGHETVEPLAPAPAAAPAPAPARELAPKPQQKAIAPKKSTGSSVVPRTTVQDVTYNQPSPRVAQKQIQPPPAQQQQQIQQQQIQQQQLQQQQTQQQKIQPQQIQPQQIQQQQIQQQKVQPQQQVQHAPQQKQIQNGSTPYNADEFSAVPHEPYPIDGMTMLCRTSQNGLPQSELGSQVSSNSAATSARPSSRDSHSDFSNLTPYSSHEMTSGKVSPVKAAETPMAMVPVDDNKVMKKKSGFFQNHSPFRRKSQKDMSTSANASNRNTWHPQAAPQGNPNNSMSRGSVYGGGQPSHQHSQSQHQVQQHQQHQQRQSSHQHSQSQHQIQHQPQHQIQHQQLLQHERTASPDPIDANASLALNIGQNVFPVSNTDRRAAANAAKSTEPETPEDDPIALALAELKGVTVGKQSSGRMSADHYHGIATPAPGARGNVFSQNTAVSAAVRGTPPPSYDQQVQRLGVPAPAVTSKAMKQASQKYTEQTRSMFSPANGGYQQGGHPGGYSASPTRQPTRNSYEMPRATSPAPRRSTSPRPGTSAAMHHQQQQPQQQQVDPRMSHRSASPNPYASSRRSVSPNPYASQGSQRPSSRQQYTPQQQQQQQMAMTPKRGDSSQYYGGSRHASPNTMSRAASPSPYHTQGRPTSSMGNPDMAVQLAPYAGGGDDGYGSQRSRGGSASRPGTSNSSRAMGLYEGGGTVRARSKSVADNRQFTRDGRPIMHFARALYVYQAAIPEELGFAKGDMMAVLRHQDDGWWEATVHGGNGQVGLVPSNYLQPC